MSRQTTFTLILAAALFCVPLQAEATDDLKAAFQNTLDQLKEKDLEGFLECWHEEAVLYTRDELFSIDRNASGHDDWAEIVEDFFARIVAAEFRPTAVKYRVIGDIGLVWGLTQFALDLRHGGGSNFDSRLTAVFARTSDGWKIVNWHSSAVPKQSDRP